jgi:multidrug efflux pump subunit AcrB
MNKKYPSFSIIVVFVMLMIVGASLIPLLNVQLNPSTSLPRTYVSFSWANASSRVIEQEVTSKLEGIAGQIKGVKNISSVSRKGSGYISIEFKKNINRDAVRFELATLIRQVYSELPEGVSYPQIRMNNTETENKGPILTYTLNASASPMYIQQYIEKYITNKIGLIKGVNDVSVYGGTPNEWVITFNSSQINTLGISAKDISGAISNRFSKRILGIINSESIEKDKIQPIRVQLESDENDKVRWDNIPIKKVDERIIYLNDIATIKYREQPPQSYHRINGLNTVNMVVYPEEEVNNVKLAETVKVEMEQIKQQLPTGYALILAYDTTTFIKEELHKIGLRTLFSMLILLLFVLLVSRKWRYLFLIFSSIIVNLTVACIFYYLLKIEIHIYALAGITVSFGMLIDNSIIMIDHIRHRGNRKVFLAILAATLTTIGALSVIFFLQEDQRANLVDFSMVIIVNLFVSMAVALFFIPALFEKLPLKKDNSNKRIRRKRRVIKLSRFYIRSIKFSKRFNWVYVIIFILGFGLPVHWLPDKIEKENFWGETYNKTLGSEWFTSGAKPILSKVLGGSLRLFSENVYNKSFYSEPERTKLYARGTMPEGCTVQQLNEAVKKMENMLSKFDEIEIFQTSIYSAQNGSIAITFKEEFEFSGFPYYLKEEMTSKAIQLGGLDWAVYGVGRGFSNSLNSGNKSSKINLEGYNYDQLYRYAEQISTNLEKNPRVKDIEITGSTNWRTESLHEFYLDFNAEQFAINDVWLYYFYGFLQNKLYRTNLPPVFINGESQSVTMISSDVDHFNVWDLNNQPITINNKELKLKNLGSVEKRKTGNSIHKNNQQYRLVIAYNFIGPSQLSQMVSEEHVKELEKALPLGYKVWKHKYNYSWDKKDKKQYYLIFLVIGIIYFICSILLESLRQPLAIIGMIPFGFIGVFLTFYLFDFNFDQGGFASFILSSFCVARPE